MNKRVICRDRRSEGWILFENAAVNLVSNLAKEFLLMAANDPMRVVRAYATLC